VEFALGPRGARWLWQLLGEEFPPEFAMDRLARVLTQPISVRLERLEWEAFVLDALQRRASNGDSWMHPDLQAEDFYK
jgi:hypothetical protein